MKLLRFFRRAFLVFSMTLLLASPAQAASRTPGTLQLQASDGTRLHLTVRGRGPYCLYIHGGPGVGSYWMERLYGDILEQHFTMVYLDQRGSGRSGSAAAGDYSPDRMVRDFEEVRRALGVERWLTLGHSFGGLLQMHYAEHFPGPVAGMVMIAPTLNLNESAEAFIRYALQILDIRSDERERYLDKEQYPMDRLQPLFGMMRERNLFWKPYYARLSSSVLMDSVMSELAAPNTAFSRQAFSMGDYFRNYKPATAGFEGPVLLYFGRTDYAVGPWHYRDITFPAMTLRFWEGGHVPFIEGREELALALNQWLKASGALALYPTK